MKPRLCPCGAVLARDNAGPLCSPCKRVEREAHYGDTASFVAKEVSYVFTHPEKYRDPRDYLKALTRSLRNLARVHGENWQVDAPASFESSGGVEADRPLCVGKYTEAAHADTPPERHLEAV